jgi:hypothetical protein
MSDTMTRDPDQLMLTGCGYTVPSKNLKWEWECILPLCDGEHHYLQIDPWEYR